MQIRAPEFFQLAKAAAIETISQELLVLNQEYGSLIPSPLSANVSRVPFNLIPADALVTHNIKRTRSVALSESEAILFQSATFCGGHFCLTTDDKVVIFIRRYHNLLPELLSFIDRQLRKINGRRCIMKGT